MRRYEGMFLFDNGVVHEWPAMEEEVRRLCDRIEAKLHVCVKFDERKLAYEIKGRKRGTYVLTYFDAEPEKIVDLERDTRLSDAVLRALFLRNDKVTEERISELQQHPADQPLQAGDGRRDDRDRDFRERRGGDRDRDRGRDRDRDGGRGRDFGGRDAGGGRDSGGGREGGPREARGRQGSSGGEGESDESD